MKPLLIALLTISALVVYSCAMTGSLPVAATDVETSPTVEVTTPAGMKKTLIELERKMWEWAKGKQVQEYRNALAPGYRSVHWNGIRDADKDIQDMLADEIRTYSLSDFNTTFPNQDTAVITYSGTMESRSDGVDSKQSFHASAVWARQYGNWKNILYQQTNAGPQSQK